MSTYTAPRTINIAALLVAGTGVLILFISAPDLFPPVPVGTIILVAAAAVVSFVPGRWTAVLGTVVPTFILIGAVASGQSLDILQGSENAGALAGTLIQLPALVIAIVAGARSTTARRSPSTATLAEPRR
jgi:hypothetical protein